MEKIYIILDRQVMRDDAMVHGEQCKQKKNISGSNNPAGNSSFLTVTLSSGCPWTLVILLLRHRALGITCPVTVLAE